MEKSLGPAVAKNYKMTHVARKTSSKTSTSTKKEKQMPMNYWNERKWKKKREKRAGCKMGNKKKSFPKVEKKGALSVSDHLSKKQRQQRQQQ